MIAQSSEGLVEEDLYQKIDSTVEIRRPGGFYHSTMEQYIDVRYFTGQVKNTILKISGSLIYVWSLVQSEYQISSVPGNCLHRYNYIGIDLKDVNRSGKIPFEEGPWESDHKVRGPGCIFTRTGNHGWRRGHV